MSTCPAGGIYYYKHSGKGNVFKSLPESADRRVQCISECVKSQPRCIGFRFEANKTCDLFDYVILDSSSESMEIWVSETGLSGN